MMRRPRVLLVVALVVATAARTASAPTLTPANATSGCSHHGVFYTDINACQCYQCFQGATCSDFNATCTIDATSASPVMEQAFWLSADVPASATTTEPAYYRTPYQPAQPQTVGLTLSNATAGIATPLIEQIVALHRRVGNVALYDSQTVVFGTGATLLIAAVEYAFQRAGGQPVTVFSQRPAYESYKDQTAVIANTTFSYREDLPADTPVLEFVTSPNNPSGEHRTPVYNTSFVVYDTVYNWPGAVPVARFVDGDVVIFSLSKLTGHAGSRFGWAFVKDATFAAHMDAFIHLMEVHTSIDAQRRALAILTAFNSGTVADTFFNSTGAELTARFHALDAALFSKPHYELVSQPGLPYAWVHCTASDDCAGEFARRGVAVRAGSFYGAGGDYARLVVAQAAPVWTRLLKRLETME